MMHVSPIDYFWKIEHANLSLVRFKSHQECTVSRKKYFCYSSHRLDCNQSVYESVYEIPLITRTPMRTSKLPSLASQLHLLLMSIPPIATAAPRAATATVPAAAFLALRCSLSSFPSIHAKCNSAAARLSGLLRKIASHRRL